MKKPATQERSDRIILFSWKVPAVGFEWRHDASPDSPGPFAPRKPFLVQNSGRTQYRETRPLDETPKLFLDFLQLSSTPEAIRVFANQHGPLGENYETYL